MSLRFRALSVGFFCSLVACEDDALPALDDAGMHLLDAGHSDAAAMNDAALLGDAQADSGALRCQDFYTLVPTFFDSDPTLESLRGCSADVDCALLEPRFECRGATNVTVVECGAAIATANLAKGTARVQAYEAAMCPRVVGDSCSSSPSCARLKAVCRDARCTVVRDTGDAGI